MNACMKQGARENKKKRAAAGEWSHNGAVKHCWVYVEGLPTGDGSSVEQLKDELATHFSKCGVLAVDATSQQPRVKVYFDKRSGLPKVKEQRVKEWRGDGRGDGRSDARMEGWDNCVLVRSSFVNEWLHD